MSRDGKDYALIAMAAGVVVSGTLWAAGALSAILTGHSVPHGHPIAGVAAFAHYRDPAAAWHGPVGPRVVYWLVDLVGLVAPPPIPRARWGVVPGSQPDSNDEPH